jgi:formate-dependent nitrite reductase membrane component NrfD
LLPSVVEAARKGRSVMRATLPIGLLFGAVAVPVLGASVAMPKTVVTLLVGPEFSAASAGLPMAALAAVAFTLSFLLATLLAALGERRGLFAAALASVLQIALMALALDRPEVGYLDLLAIKAALQCALAAGLVFFTVLHLGQITRDRPL